MKEDKMPFEQHKRIGDAIGTHGELLSCQKNCTGKESSIRRLKQRQNKHECCLSLLGRGSSTPSTPAKTSKVQPAPGPGRK